MLLLISIMKVQPQLGLKEITKGGGSSLVSFLVQVAKPRYIWMYPIQYHMVCRFQYL